MTELKKQKENWGSQIGAILAVAGCAIGLGNFLRFPGQAALHGGGAFMIPYFVAFLVLAVPLTWSEWALGRSAGRKGFNSVPGIYRAAGKHRRWGYIGAVGVILPLGISMYYVYIQGWCLAYALQYLMGIFHSWGVSVPSLMSGISPGFTLGSAEGYENFFSQFIGTSANGAIFQNGFGSPLLICLLFCLFFNYFLIYRGISKGIEAFCKIAMPLLLVCSFLILFRVLTLGNPLGVPGQGLLDGLGFMWNPSRPGESIMDTLANPDAWLAATSQIFFSVSLGFGLIMTYASYVKPNDDIALSGLTATSGNEFCEVVLGGLMIIPPAIMFLGLNAMRPETLNSTFSMGFIVLPNVFEMMPGGQIFGFLFFFLLFLAAVTSAISMSQPAVAFWEETLDFTRRQSVLTVAGICCIGTFIVCWFSQGAKALDTFDFWVGNLGLFVLATFQTILAAWIWGTDNMLDELDRGAKIRVPRGLGFVLKYVSTPYLLIVLAVWSYTNLGGRLKEAWSDGVVQVALAFLFAVLMLFVGITKYSEKRWQELEKMSEVQK